MKTMNTFELVFEILDRRPALAAPLVIQTIKIDGVEINSNLPIDLPHLVRSLHFEGEYYIFTCGCGEAGCAGIFEGVHVSFEGDLIKWLVRDPIAKVGYENFEDWDADAKTICYTFNKKAMIDNISVAVDIIKNRANDSMEFSPYGFGKKYLERLDPSKGYEDVYWK